MRATGPATIFGSMLSLTGISDFLLEYTESLSARIITSQQSMKPCGQHASFRVPCTVPAQSPCDCNIVNARLPAFLLADDVHFTVHVLNPLELFQIRHRSFNRFQGMHAMSDRSVQCILVGDCFWRCSRSNVSWHMDDHNLMRSASGSNSPYCGSAKDSKLDAIAICS